MQCGHRVAWRARVSVRLPLAIMRRGARSRAMQNNTVETLMGAIVVAVAALFLFYAYSSTGAGRVSGYDLEARFASADGITSGTDVRLHGIKIGTVSSMNLDPKTYQAVVH